MLEDVSRRTVLKGAGALSAAVAASTVLKPGTAQAQPMQDIPLLNALLSAEYGAIAAYTAGAGILTTPPAGDPQAAVAPAALAVAVHFQSQHREHAAKLAGIITASGGTPVAESSVMFTAPAGFRAGVLNVIRLACNAEKAAAIGYAETLKSLSVQTSAEVVAAIGGVETQHFIVLFLLANGIVAPSSTVVAADVVPQAFVSRLGAGTTGLQDVPDFTY